MLGGIFMGGVGGLNEIPQPQTTNAKANEFNSRMRELEHQVGRLAMLNQALWELLRDRLGLKDQDLERIAKEIDLRDGVEDGRITVTPLECPSCGRVSSSKHWKCLYCGQLFEKPVMG